MLPSHHTLPQQTARPARSGRPVPRRARIASGILGVLLAVGIGADARGQDGEKSDQFGSNSNDDFGFAAERESLPEVASGRFSLPNLGPRSTATDEIGNGKTPESFRADQPAPITSLPESGSQRDSQSEWNWSIANWAAPNTFSNPRFFEDRMLERHGHERFGLAQPLASGFRFAATLPMLPYLMAINDPCECEYTLGHYRSGNCAPRVFQRPPRDRRAILVESAAVATGFIALP